MEQNKEQYQTAEIEIVKVAVEDVICTSSETVQGSNIQDLGDEEGW